MIVSTTENSAEGVTAASAAGTFSEGPDETGGHDPHWQQRVRRHAPMVIARLLLRFAPKAEVIALHFRQRRLRHIDRQIVEIDVNVCVNSQNMSIQLTWIHGWTAEVFELAAIDQIGTSFNGAPH